MSIICRELPAVLGGTPAIRMPRPVWPVVTEELIEAVTASLREGRLSEIFGGDYIARLEAAFCEYHGSEFALSLSGGTAALDCAVYASGVGPGDEVITSTVCPAYVITPILHMNGIPVFADIDPRTGNIDPGEIERHITGATKAIMVVHLSGHPADMDSILEVARRHNLRVIEDCAHSQGSTYKGRRTGTIGDFGAFSLQAVKNLACGEGGMLLTSDRVLYEKARFVGWNTSNYTMKDGIQTYFGDGLGWNYRITMLAAVIGLEQMRSFDRMMELRRLNANRITEGVRELPGIYGTLTLPDYYDQQIHFEPEELGLELPELLWALHGEGVGASPIDVPVYNAGIFRQRDFYGKGCPWSCRFAQGEPRRYDDLLFPKTEEMQRTTLRMILGGLITEDEAPALEHIEAFAKIASHAGAVRKAYRDR